ncbi:Phosphotyrosine protein phosphatase I superfamily [Desulfovibrio sp. X2]|uniref:arsenate reductase ArsC n=1 Tax=Desulfovibrio sp. X2 TaxID=941449 RepID=UPI000358B0BE|nr:arsenate reductase ArsC [Desulfovibrio sp. X2]EPR37668.1 Phosphotyrosine protein phosphatase I superfamily [Desulfovibrio sp. X2]
MKRVLFICSHNSARSQMAEAFLNAIGAPDYTAESAGLEPTSVNPYVVQAMREEGLDLGTARAKSVFDLFRQGRLYDYVVTVCAEAEEKCPVFPGVTHRLHLPFADPATFTGSPEEILAQIRTVRDEIRAEVTRFVAWCAKGCQGSMGRLQGVPEPGA